LKCGEFGRIFPQKIHPFVEVAGRFLNWRHFASKKTLAPTSSEYQGFFCLLFPNFVVWLTKVATIQNLAAGMCEDK
jgi:hypothetical protein